METEILHDKDIKIVIADSKNVGSTHVGSDWAIETGDGDVEMVLKENENLIDKETSNDNPGELEYASMDENTMVSSIRESIKLTNEVDPNRSSVLQTAASALLKLFNHSGNTDLLEEAIGYGRTVLALNRDHPSDDSDAVPASMNDLGNLLLTRFEQIGQADDLDESIQLYSDALALASNDHRWRQSLDNLANALATRYESNEEMEDLNKSIEYSHQSLSIIPHLPDRWIALNNISRSISMRFEEKGDEQDLKEAIQFSREAIDQCPDDEPNLPALLVNLAASLRCLYEKDGQVKVLQEAIKLTERALSIFHPGNPDRSAPLINLGEMLALVFEHSGKLAHLDDAITFSRKSLKALNPGNPSRFNALSALGYALNLRFEYWRKIEDLDEIIRVDEECLKEHQGRSLPLSNLGSSLLTRYESLGKIPDLQRAIECLEKTLEMRPAGHHRRSTSLSLLANALMARFLRMKDISDIDQAIEYNRQGLELRPPGHAERNDLLCNYGSALMIRYEKTQNPSDLSQSLEFHREALEKAPEGHPVVFRILHGIGDASYWEYKRTDSREALHFAIESWKQAISLSSAPAIQRLDIAMRWAEIATKHDHASAMEAYELSIGLLPRLALLGLDISSRHRALRTKSSDLPSQAARCAIKAGNFTRAVELLEQGRAIFWQQAQKTHSPELTLLKSTVPDLADEVIKLAREIEAGSFRNVAASDDDDDDDDDDEMDSEQQVLGMEKEANKYRELGERFDRLVLRVREEKGLERFLLPMQISKLKLAAAHGAVVMLTCSGWESDALIIRSPRAEVERASLGKELKAEALRKRLKLAIQYSSGRGAGPYKAPEEDTSATIQDILLRLWSCVVQPILKHLDIKKSANPPRIWWCATGPFAFLPIHAAGVYGTSEDKYLTDYLVSSYTPTLRSLVDDLPAEEPKDIMEPPKDTAEEKFKCLLIAVTNADGQPYLRHAVKELREIEAVALKGSTITLEDELATVENVSAKIHEATIVHLACHAQQNPYNALESSFLLQDGRLKISKLMEVVQFKRQALAYLSACQTAKTDEAQPDEALNLASTMIFMGFKGVIGTMWSIQDEDGPLVARDVYSVLFQKTPTDITDAAGALQHAVRHLRETGAPFVRWVPFVHIGA